MSLIACDMTAGPCVRCCARTSRASDEYVRPVMRSKSDVTTWMPGSDPIQLRDRPRRAEMAYAEPRRVAGRGKGDVENIRKCEMLAVARGDGVAVHRDDHVRPERANDRDDIGDDRIAVPMSGERGVVDRREKHIIDGAYWSEVVRAREVLMCAVDAARGEQLLRANAADRRADVRSADR